MRLLLAYTAFVYSAVAFGQSASAPNAGGHSSFPSDSVAPAASDLKAMLSGKRFIVKPKDGNDVRLNFKDNGYLFVNSNAGFNASGPWRTEDGKLCTDGKIGSNCFDARAFSGRLFIKRVSGEIVEYFPD